MPSGRNVPYLTVADSVCYPVLPSNPYIRVRCGNAAPYPQGLWLPFSLLGACATQLCFECLHSICGLLYTRLLASQQPYVGCWFVDRDPQAVAQSDPESVLCEGKTLLGGLSVILRCRRSITREN